MRARDVGHRHPRDRRVEVEERLVGDHRGDLRAEAAGAQILVDDQAAAGAADAVQHHLAVPRIERAQVDDVGADALRRGLAARHHRAPGDDGDCIALAGLLRPAERQHIIVARPRPPRPGIVEHRAMLEEHHRVVAAQRAREAARPHPRRWTAPRPSSRDCGRTRTSLVMAVPRVAAFEEAAGHAQHHRRGEAVVGAPAHRPAIVDLLGRRLGIFAELDFRDRHQPGQRHADRAADDPFLVERGVEHPLAPELVLQAERHRMDPALGADVLAEHQHRADWPRAPGRACGGSR